MATTKEGMEIVPTEMTPVNLSMKELRRTADLVFRRARVAVFLDGCFWHGCPKHGRKPGSNRGYWLRKLRRNKARDAAVSRQLSRTGWRVIRLWEHQLANPDAVATTVDGVS